MSEPQRRKGREEGLKGPGGRPAGSQVQEQERQPDAHKAEEKEGHFHDKPAPQPAAQLRCDVNLIGFPGPADPGLKGFIIAEWIYHQICFLVRPDNTQL